MNKGFTFDGALMFAFRAAHVRTFPWFFALAFATVCTALSGLAMFLMKDTIFGFFDQMTALASSDAASEEEVVREVFGTMFSLMRDMAPLMILGTLVSWVVWSIFETASQRRYIRDEPFSLGFGADELRMMGTSFFWFLMQAVLFLLPVVAMFSIFGSMMSFLDGSITEDEFTRAIMGSALIAPLSMLFLFPLYVFLATRFSPCFGLTVKDRKIAFREAWAVSRGRFWPILGAYLIIAIVGGMAAGAVASVAQIILMPAMMNANFLYDDVPDFRSLMTPGFVVAALVYTFVRYFMSGLLMHFADGPAAFAARHDPRGSVDDALKVTEFD